MTRFRWLVLGGLVGFLLAAGYLRFQLRSEYRSVGRIRILAPIAEWSVPSTGTATEQATLIRQIRATALATSTLQNIIATYGLYPGELDRLPAATVVNKFRKNLEITVTEGQIIVSCTYTDPTLAQKVAADLLGRMVSEYSRESLLQAEATWHFMEARFGQVATQLADAKRDLQNARGGATSVLQMNVECV